MKRHFGGTAQVSAAEPKSKPAPRRSPAMTAKPAQALKANAPQRKPARKAARAKPTPRRSR